MISFHKYNTRGNYLYVRSSNDTSSNKYYVIKDGFGIDSCNITKSEVDDNIFRLNEVDWLIKRTRNHYSVLGCFWFGVAITFTISVAGTIFEYRQKDYFKGEPRCVRYCQTIIRFLRSFVYKSCVVLPSLFLFAFDYTTPCLKLRASIITRLIMEEMIIFSAIFTAAFGLLTIDLFLEGISNRPNAT
ncbi:unnamed protein product, partial [Didymodactylos carnosus]